MMSKATKLILSKNGPSPETAILKMIIPAVRRNTILKPTEVE
jgi:hypothetical protein